MPEGCVLEFDGGSIRNGKIFLNNTIINSNNVIFYNIDFDGILENVVDINWFNIRYNQKVDNSQELGLAFKLSFLSKKRYLKLNKDSIIYIDSTMLDTENRIARLHISISNFELDLNNSTIISLPNGSDRYYLIRATNADNLIIRNGTLIGDKYSHIGTTGEWGYGIDLSGCHNCIIENLVVKECWGDGIALTKYGNSDGDPTSELTAQTHCGNILLTNCIFEDNGRNNLSVICALNTYVENCEFNKADRTLPMVGVDVEPDTADTYVIDIYFKNCKFKENAIGAISASGQHNETLNISNIQNIIIDSCFFSNNGDYESNGYFGGIMMSNTSNIRILNVVEDENYFPSTRITFHFLRGTSVLIEKTNISQLLINSSEGLDAGNIEIKESKFIVPGNNIALQGVISKLNIKCTECIIDSSISNTSRDNIGFYLTPISDVDNCSITFDKCRFISNQDRYFYFDPSIKLQNCELNRIIFILSSPGTYSHEDYVISNCSFYDCVLHPSRKAIFVFNKNPFPKNVTVDISNNTIYNTKDDEKIEYILFSASNLELIKVNYSNFKVFTELNTVPRILNRYLTSQEIICDYNTDKITVSDRFLEPLYTVLREINLGPVEYDRNLYQTIKLRKPRQTRVQLEGPNMSVEMSKHGLCYSIQLYPSNNSSKQGASAIYQIQEGILSNSGGAYRTGKVYIYSHYNIGDVLRFKVNKNIRRDDEFVYIDIAYISGQSVQTFISIWDDVNRCDATSDIIEIIGRDHDDDIDGVDDANYVTEYSGKYLRLKYDEVFGSKLGSYTTGYYDKAVEGAIIYLTDRKRYVMNDGEQWINLDGTPFEKEGGTSSRPNNIDTGFQYFDTTINKPIWWTGSSWVDATGTQV